MSSDLNQDRSRWYGLREGDFVEQRAFGHVIRGNVILLHFTDNNGCTLETEHGNTKAVCEWCEIIKRVDE